MTNDQTAKHDILTLSHLTSLYELYLSHSCISDLSCIESLTQLEALDFNQPTTDTIRLISSSLTNLVSLTLRDCNNLKISWENLPRLEYLTLQQATLDSTVTQRQSLLRYITLKGCTVSPLGFQSLSTIKSLVYLELRVCKLSNMHYNILSNFTQIKTLILKDEYLFQPASVPLDSLSKLTTLCQLTMKNLHCNNLSFLEHLVQLKSFGLVDLHLSGGATTEHISKLTNLESLYITSLNTNQVVLTNMTKLQSLTLAKSGKLSSFIASVKKLPRLEWLDVSRMYLSDDDRVLLAHTFPFVTINWTKEK